MIRLFRRKRRLTFKRKIFPLTHVTVDGQPKEQTDDPDRHQDPRREGDGTRR